MITRIIGLGIVVLLALMYDASLSGLYFIVYMCALILMEMNQKGKFDQEMSDYRRRKNTQIKAVENERILNQKILKTLIKTMSSPMLYIDRNGIICFTNNSFKDNFGLSDIQGKYYKDVLGQGLLQIVQECYLFEKKYNETRKLGERYYQVDSNPLIKNQLFYGTILLFVDVSKVKEIEKFQKQFLSDVSHELKTPMSAIIGSVEILNRRSGDMDEITKEFMEILLKESERMQNLIDDILVLSKLERPKQELNHVFVDVNKLIENTIQLFQELANEKGIEIQFITMLEDGLVLDYKSLKTIITNLISNAIKYSDGGIIRISVLYKEGTMILIVKDHGKGIAAKNIPLIFDRFFQEDRSRGIDMGTGLGLSIVKKVIENNNGSIEVVSELNKGSEFTVHIPVS
ncbi:sensor histidine kinase [Tannockella kyphosi]|uniref:sensor histidine kinase n=1 Tax=Tannockella kyphosi TaxID=2899121 RepID=UPI0020123749|nr:PAS domain-containing sensor histidine kinase [Tannockella kyphosi]